jgi:hypothetical protein
MGSNASKKERTVKMEKILKEPGHRVLSTVYGLGGNA